ncbi:MAG: hypothetical protein ACR2MI_04570 [Flavobacteriaceae bacterium]
MKKNLIFTFLLIALCFSCISNSSNQTVSATTEALEDETEDLVYDFSLNEYPAAFLMEEQLDEWEDFERLYNSMKRLSELNLNDVQVDLLALSTRIKNISKSKFPGNLEVPQLRSRLKVVEMQAQKSRYFTRYYKKDSLVPSIEKLYTAYNAFLFRMLSLKEESSAVSTETVSID